MPLRRFPCRASRDWQRAAQLSESLRLLTGGPGRSGTSLGAAVDSQGAIHVTARLARQRESVAVGAPGDARRKHHRDDNCHSARRGPWAFVLVASANESFPKPPRRRFEQVSAHCQASVEHLAQQFFSPEDSSKGNGIARHNRQPSLGCVGGRGERVDRRYLERQVNPAHTGEVDGETQQVGALGERRQPPCEGEREVVLVGRVHVLGQVYHRILEREQSPGIDLQGQMEVQRAAATLFGMQIDLPGLSQGIGLYEVPLVVDVKPMVYRMVFQVGHVSRYVYDCHFAQSLSVDAWCTPGRRAGNLERGQRDKDGQVEDQALLWVCERVVDAVGASLGGVDDWSAKGGRPGQYAIDLTADRAALEVLDDAGLGVLSEESGLRRPGSALMAVLDPVDGSTNASRRVPWYATSICIIDEAGPRVAVVGNLATGERYRAVRGEGAWKGDERLSVSGCTELHRAVVALSGFPRHHLGWAQFRAFGAAALELCAVAEGSLDAFVAGGGAHIAPWDYLGGVLVCTEAGGHVCDLSGRELVTTDPEARRAVAGAATEVLLAQLRDAVLGTGGQKDSASVAGEG